MYALVSEEAYKNGNGYFDANELTPYTRIEMYYTWREYCEATGKERYK
jgi:hypothetical protein